MAEFEQAIQLAPWVGEYHYNTALMLKSKAGSSDLEAAMRSIKLARLLAKDDKEKRDATALSAKLEVALEVTRESVAKEAKLTAARKMEEEKINALIPGTAYLISTDGSEVTDQKTGLIWRRCVEGMVCSGGACSGEGREFNYEQALQRAKSEASRSGKAWRVPEAHELVGLVDKSRSPMINPTAFPAQPCTDGSYGSCAFRAATRSVEYPAAHLVVSFRAGVGDDNTSSIVFDKYAFYLRLVRDGQ